MPKQARIRLNEETATALHEVLYQYLSAQWEIRATVQRSGGDTNHYNRGIRMTKRLMAEVQRARKEAGWLTNSSDQNRKSTGTNHSQTPSSSDDQHDAPAVAAGADSLGPSPRTMSPVTVATASGSSPTRALSGTHDE